MSWASSIQGERMFSRGMVMSRGKVLLEGQPVVATVGRTAAILDVDPDELAAVITAAGIPVWGTHASGADVYSWRLIVQAVAEAGLAVPPAVRKSWARYRAAGQRKTNAYGREV